MKVLCLDIGNSNTKAALFINNELENFRFIKNDDELLSFIQNIDSFHVAISSVSPNKLQKILNLLHLSGGQKPFIISRENNFKLKLNYATPETLGLDRLCAAEGAFYLHKKNTRNFSEKTLLICIDFGTATTLNLVKFPGIFAGGVIAPGINTMFASLNQNTAQLPIATHKEYIGLIGNSTKSAIASGVINSTIGLIEKFINDLYSKDSEHFIYVTGGNAEAIISFLKQDFYYEKALVCYGIFSLFKANN